jgi:hypothetical protein
MDILMIYLRNFVGFTTNQLFVLYERLWSNKWVPLVLDNIQKIRHSRSYIIMKIFEFSQVWLECAKKHVILGVNFLLFFFF